MKGIKSIRLKHYDYSTNGYYFVTISANQQDPIIERHKSVVVSAIEGIKKTKGVKVDYRVVMPTHLHMILVLEDCHLPLGEIVRRFKGIVSRKLGVKIWQPNYYEHVIRNENALRKIREYIQNNPSVERIRFKDFY